MVKVFMGLWEIKKAPKPGAYIGDPGGVRTHNLQNRNLIFYPVELRDQYFAKVLGFCQEYKCLNPTKGTLNFYPYFCCFLCNFYIFLPE
jgi:hypothetical protein